MKTTFALCILATALVCTISVQAGPVESEEAFDRAAGLFKHAWKPTPKVVTQRFPAPTPPQVQPVLPPWSQQPQGAQTSVPVLTTVDPDN